MMKFRIYFDKDAAARWLNQMADHGWNMTGFFAGLFFFQKCQKGAWQYQVDLRSGFGKKTSDYRLFMEEAGIDVIQNWGFWTFLRKPASEKPFELYTDIDSSLAHYKKIRTMFKIITIVELFCLAVELIAAVNGSRAGFAFSFLIGGILLILLNQIVRINRVINELKERRDGILQKCGRRNISLFLAAGMLLNAAALLLQEHIADPFHHTIQIAALVLMAIGVFITFRNR